MKPLDAKRLARFIRLSGDRLKGDWVVIGGSVLPLLGVAHRVTVDIDLVGPEGATAAETLKLLELAESMGLPPEAINQAGALFLRRIKGWEQRLVLLHQGRTARLYRPDATLFIRLKLGRLSEADLTDCLVMLDHARRNKEPVDAPHLRRTIRHALRNSPSQGRDSRLESLLSALAE